MEMTHQVNLPDGPRTGSRVLCLGDIIETWCSRHGEIGKSTRHLYQADYPALVCLECHPEKDPARQEAER